MNKVVLFCKSYRNDILRVERLLSSIIKYNKEDMPFYLSVPKKDIDFFRDKSTCGINLIADEEIFYKNHGKINYNDIDGQISQQIVKSEFWRLELSENYLCLDSDCEFVRSFYKKDFVHESGCPYTVISESKSLFEFCARYNLTKVKDNFIKSAKIGQDVFNRTGKLYDFGPIPVVWSSKVWKALDENYLLPNRLTLCELLLKYPSEISIYGEALLKYQPIRLLPCEPFFKVYHYEAQHFYDQKRKITQEMIAQNYLGIIKQSNWDNLDYDKSRKGFISRALKQAKRFFRYLSV